MTSRIIKIVTAGAFLAASTAMAPVAIAQSTTTPAAPSATTTPAAPSATTDMAEAPVTYLTEQGPDQVSANTYIGQTVYNATDEKIGDINDLILEKDGGLVAAVIGVGGFLGLGQKTVAVPMTSITVSQGADGGNMKLTTTETAETLKAAPEFKTLADKTDTTTTSSTEPGTPMTTPAVEPETPAAPAAPAEPAN